MARSKTETGVGHNSRGGLDAGEIEALGVHHQLKISAEQTKLAVLVEQVASQRKVVNAAFKRMTADLGFTRDRFETEVIDKLNMTPDEYAAFCVETDMLHRIAGLKQGEQIDLIEHVMKGDTVDESEAAFQDGYRAGRRADDPSPPDYVAGILHPKWMEGWHAGQAYNGEQLKRAHEIMSRPKPGEMAAAPEPSGAKPLPEPGTPEHDAALRASEQLARESLGLVPTAAEQDFEEADNGRTIRAIDEAA